MARDKMASKKTDVYPQVRVLYDYEYLDDNGKVWMEVGEQFCLLDRSAGDWWQVCRSDSLDQPFYVPSTYVEVLQDGNGTRDSDLSTQHPGYRDNAAYNQEQNNDNQNNNETVVNLSGNMEDNYINCEIFKKPGKNGTSETFEVRHMQGVTRPTSLGDGGDYANLETIRSAAGIPNPPTPESDYANLQQLQMQEPSLPSLDACEYQKTLSDTWDVYHDPATNRVFYMHKETKEAQWKPPRGQFHAQLQNKWIRTQDEYGRNYFYRNDSHGSESSWNLPVRSTGSSPSKSPSSEGKADPFSSVPTTGSSGQVGPSTHHQRSQEPIEGHLNKCVLQNGIKKQSKKWAWTFAKLSGSNLIFYKDQKSQNAPKQLVSLVTCSVTKDPKDFTSKKNTILITCPECQILLQAEDDIKMKEWFVKLHTKIEELGGKPDKQEPEPVAGLSPLSNEPVTRKPSFKEKKHMRKPSDGGSLERKGRLTDFLNKFMSNRKDKESLIKKGIIKDAVFGADLKTICEREKEKVPLFVNRCIAAIEARGLHHEGIYRIGGNIASIQTLRCKVDQGEDYDLEDKELDINVLTGSLKLFFRELKEPLFTYPLFDKFLQSFLKESASDRLKAIKATVKELPMCHYETIKVLFKHLVNVTDKHLENKMQAHQLAIVFGPTLIWPEVQSQNLATSMVYQSRIVEFILLEYKNIFR